LLIRHRESILDGEGHNALLLGLLLIVDVHIACVCGYHLASAVRNGEKDHKNIIIYSKNNSLNFYRNITLI
jgi:hypothetical protein